MLRNAWIYIYEHKHAYLTALKLNVENWDLVYERTDNFKKIGQNFI